MEINTDRVFRLINIEYIATYNINLVLSTPPHTRSNTRPPHTGWLQAASVKAQIITPPDPRDREDAAAAADNCSESRQSSFQHHHYSQTCQRCLTMPRLFYSINRKLLYLISNILIIILILIMININNKYILCSYLQKRTIESMESGY